MSAVTIRNLSDEAQRALKARARRNGRSTEAEIRDILEVAARGEDQRGLASRLMEIGQAFGGIELDLAREDSPFTPSSFE